MEGRIAEEMYNCWNIKVAKISIKEFRKLINTEKKMSRIEKFISLRKGFFR